jgi:hypothetical protein
MWATICLPGRAGRRTGGQWFSALYLVGGLDGLNRLCLSCNLRIDLGIDRKVDKFSGPHTRRDSLQSPSRCLRHRRSLHGLLQQKAFLYREPTADVEFKAIRAGGVASANAATKGILRNPATARAMTTRTLLSPLSSIL